MPVSSPSASPDVSDAPSSFAVQELERIAPSFVAEFQRLLPDLDVTSYTVEADDEGDVTKAFLTLHAADGADVVSLVADHDIDADDKPIPHTFQVELNMLDDGTQEHIGILTGHLIGKDRKGPTLTELLEGGTNRRASIADL